MSYKRALPILVALIVFIIYLPFPYSHFWYSDESRHAMDGVFIFYLLKKLKIFSPISYAYRFYESFPAIAIGYYPPLFAIVEALFFFIFGISVNTAKITVATFVGIGAYFLFKLLLLYFDEFFSIVGVLIFFTYYPHLKWGKAVMLELPAISLSITATYFFLLYYFSNKKSRYMVLAFIFMLLSICTKQTTGFLLFLFLCYGIYAEREQFLKKHRKLILLSILIIFFGILITIFITPINIHQTIGTVKGMPSRLSLKCWSYYIKKLPLYIGYTGIIMLIVGILNRKKMVFSYDFFFMLWIILCYILFSLISYKTVRLGILWIMGLHFFILKGLKIFWKKPLICLLIGSLIIGENVYRWNKNYRSTGNFQTILSKISPFPRNILYQGYYNGNFIFECVRALNADLRYHVFRSSKLFVKYRIMKRYGREVLVKTEDNIHFILNKKDVELVIIEENSIKEDPVFKKVYQVAEKLYRKKEKMVIEGIPTGIVLNIYKDKKE